MATSYPNALPVLRRIAATLQGPPFHTDVEDDQTDTVEALAATLGVNPHGTYPNVAARLAGMLTSITGLVGRVTNLEVRVTPVSKGGTGATSAVGILQGFGDTIVARSGWQVLDDLGFRWGAFPFTFGPGQSASVVNTIMLDRGLIWCDVQLATTLKMIVNPVNRPNEPGEGQQGFQARFTDGGVSPSGGIIPANYFALVAPRI